MMLTAKNYNNIFKFVKVVYKILLFFFRRHGAFVYLYFVIMHRHFFGKKRIKVEYFNLPECISISISISLQLFQ